jgi:Holliday junction resolvase RusA-like endonuclease
MQRPNKEREVMQQAMVVVPGPPQGKARARTGYNPRKGRITSYTPEKTVLYENLIKTCYMEQSKVFFESDVALDIEICAYYEPPKSTSKKRQRSMLDWEEFPTKKPDADNIAKVVLDALNGVAYSDDKQVVNLAVTKRYDRQAKVEIEIRRAEI